MGIKQTLKSKNGFTLVELIVSITIAAVVIAAVGSLLVSTYHLYGRSVDIANARAVDSIVEKILRPEIMYGTGFRVSADGSALYYDSQIYGGGCELRIDQGLPVVVTGGGSVIPLLYPQQTDRGALSFGFEIAQTSVTVTVSGSGGVSRFTYDTINR